MYVVCLCKRCFVFCLYCDVWSCRCSCMGSMSVSSCRCLGVFVTLLLNVMELLWVVRGALLDKPCMVFQRMCVLCL